MSNTSIGYERLNRQRNWPSDYGGDQTGTVVSDDAFSASIAQHGGFHIPSGHSYRISANIALADGQYITGDGWNSKLIVDDSLTEAAVSLNKNSLLSNLAIVREEITGGTLASITAGSKGVEFVGDDPTFLSRAKCHKVLVRGVENGFYCDFAGVLTLDSCLAWACTQGLNLAGTQDNGLLSLNSEFFSCETGVLDQSNGSQVEFYGGAIEGNGLYGYRSTTQSKVNRIFDGVYFEGNGTLAGGGDAYDLIVEAAGGINNLLVRGCWFNGTKYAVYLLSTFGGKLEHNYFQNNTKSVYLGGTSCRFTEVAYNRYGSGAAKYDPTTDDLGRGTINSGGAAADEIYGDFTTDDTANLQRYITKQRNREFVQMPRGRFRTTSKLMAIVGTSFQSVTIRGHGGYVSENGAGATQIYADFTDDCCLAIQGAREVEVEGIEFLGKNLAPTNLTVGHTVQTAMTEIESDWVTSGCSNGRYNPYAAIGIDPYSGNQPGSDYYPNSPYASGANQHSTKIQIRRCTFRNFVDGIAIKPSDNDSNADTIFIYNCHFRDLLYGVSLGNSQSRAVTIEDSYFLAMLSAIEGSVRGRQVGSPPMVRGCEFAFCYNLIRCGTGTGHISFQGCYGESLKRIGVLGKGLASLMYSASFQACHFKFRDVAGTDTSDPNDASVHLWAFCPVSFNACSFSCQRGAFNIGGAQHVVDFQSCEWNTLDTTWNLPFYVGVNDSYGNPQVRLAGSDFRTPKYSQGSGTRWNCPDTESVVTSVPARMELSHHTRRVLGPRYSLTVENFPLASSRTRVSCTASGYSLTGDTLTFTAGDPTDFLVDDVLFWRSKAEPYCANGQNLGVAFRVSNINGTTITAKAFVGYNNLDAAYAPSSIGIAYSPVAQGAAITCSTTATSATISNVASPSTYFAVGDFITGPGIQSRTRVTALGVSTITISKAATITADYVHIYCDHAWPDHVPLDSPDAMFAPRDGTNSDLKSIMAQLSYRGDCRMLKGSYWLGLDETIVTPTGSILRGDGMQNTLLVPNAASVAPLVTVGQRSLVEDFYIDGTDVASSVGINFNSTSGCVRRVQVIDMAKGFVIADGFALNTIIGCRASSCGTAIEVNTANGISIRDFYGDACTIGIDVPGQPGSLLIDGGELTNMVTAGARFTNSAGSPCITGVYFNANGVGVVGNTDGLTGADVIVTGNVRSLGMHGCRSDSSDFCFAASNGKNGVISENTLNPNLHTIRLSNAAASGYTIGPNTELAHAFDPSVAGGDNVPGLLTRILPFPQVSQTILPDPMLAGASWSTNLVLPGARGGDTIALSVTPLPPVGTVVDAYCDASDNVVVRFGNPTAGTLTPVSTTFLARVVR